MQERLFYVRRHLRADGSSQWYVLNGHIRRACEQTKAEAEARRAKLQVPWSEKGREGGGR